MSGIGTVGYAANYDPYGNAYASDGFGGTLGFTGEQTDVSGLQYLRARYMDTATGTFLTKDPVQGVVGMSITFNGYQYAHGNPVNLTDPSGKFPPLLIALAAGTLIGAAIGATVGAATNIAQQIGELRAQGIYDPRCIMQNLDVGRILKVAAISAVVGAAAGFVGVLAGTAVTSVFTAAGALMGLKGLAATAWGVAGVAFGGIYGGMAGTYTTNIITQRDPLEGVFDPVCY